MCGIFALFNSSSIKQFLPYFAEMRHRGPDNTKTREITPKIWFGFHRLCINGLDRESDQPFFLESCSLVCNGEIYNFRELAEKYGFELQTHSDCEIIIHLYRKFGIEKCCTLLDGVFAFALYDNLTETMYVARDPIGIRSLYIGRYLDGSICFASEMKGMICDRVDDGIIGQFPPGTWSSSESGFESFNRYYYYKWYPIIGEKIGIETITKTIKKLLTTAVKKRTMSDRPVCSLLSGGLDSTLVSYLLSKEYEPYTLHTYSIGLEGSPDLKFAEIAAREFKTIHHSVVVTEEEFLGAIEKTVRQIESWCITSVRASVGNYLVSLKIQETSDNVVVFCGDLSDEIFGSYRGFMKSPDKDAFFEANVKMLEEVHKYDVLRSDKSISGASLEARVPFADKDLVNYVMSLDPALKMFGKERMEKWILRKAFEGDISDQLLWRSKEAFSDGVSHENRSWYKIIEEHVEKMGFGSEEEWYRSIFERFYPGKGESIGKHWKHPFHGENEDPSARSLACYSYEN